LLKLLHQRSDLRQKCIKFNFGWGSASDPNGRAYNTPSDPQAGFWALLLRVGKGREQGRIQRGG